MASKTQIERLNLLAEYLEMAEHNLYCYSSNYLRETPKKGFEKEFLKSKEKIRILNEMIGEIN